MQRRSGKNSAKIPPASRPSDPSEASDPGPAAKKPHRIIFEYPALPKFEIIFYFLFMIGTFSYAWFRVFEVSSTYDTGRTWKIQESDWKFFNGWRLKDYTNYEWRMVVPWFQSSVFFMFGHSLLFNLTENFLGRFWKPFMLFYWFAAVSYITSVKFVLGLILQGFIMYGATKINPRWYTIWGTGALILYHVIHNVMWYIDLGFTGGSHLVTLLFLTYKQLQYISYCWDVFLETPANKRRPFWEGFYELLWYAFYLPYTISIVRIYRRFPAELETRNKRVRNWPLILFFGLRILFWYFVNEFLIHIFYFDAIIRDPDMMYQIPLDTLVSIGYTAGQFFHMKYCRNWKIDTFTYNLIYKLSISYITYI